MLNHESVKKRPEIILEELKIDSNFFQVTEEYRRRKNKELEEKDLSRLLLSRE